MDLQAQGVDPVVLDQGIETSTAVARRGSGPMSAEAEDCPGEARTVSTTRQLPGSSK